MKHDPTFGGQVWLNGIAYGLSTGHSFSEGIGPQGSTGIGMDDIRKDIVYTEDSALFKINIQDFIKNLQIDWTTSDWALSELHPKFSGLNTANTFKGRTIDMIASKEAMEVIGITDVEILCSFEEPFDLFLSSTPRRGYSPSLKKKTTGSTRESYRR